MYARYRILVLVLAFTFAPSLVEAQAQQPNASRSVPAAGPRVTLTATAARQHAQVSDSAAITAAAARRQNMGRPVALMIVGGGAFVAGALIGGDAGTIIMIAGLVTGLIGLYQYLE